MVVVSVCRGGTSPYSHTRQYIHFTVIQESKPLYSSFFEKLLYWYGTTVPKITMGEIIKTYVGLIVV